MKMPALTSREVELLCGVFRRHREIHEVKIYGSRAKGTHKPGSDVDLALRGDLDALQAEAIASELDELPLPYRFDVTLLESITLAPLREHIERVGISLYSLSI